MKKRNTVENTNTLHQKLCREGIPNLQPVIYIAIDMQKIIMAQSSGFQLNGMPIRVIYNIYKMPVCMYVMTYSCL